MPKSASSRRACPPRRERQPVRSESRSSTSRASGAGAVPLPRSTRDPRVETLRGLAILLVVAEHVIGQDSSNGLRLPDDSLYLYASHSLDFVRMPLFTFLSGAVYAMRPLAPGGARGFLRGKAKKPVHIGDAHRFR